MKSTSGPLAAGAKINATAAQKSGVVVAASGSCAPIRNEIVEIGSGYWPTNCNLIRMEDADSPSASSTRRYLFAAYGLV